MFMHNHQKALQQSEKMSSGYKAGQLGQLASSCFCKLHLGMPVDQLPTLLYWNACFPCLSCCGPRRGDPRVQTICWTIYKLQVKRTSQEVGVRLCCCFYLDVVLVWSPRSKDSSLLIESLFTCYCLELGDREGFFGVCLTSLHACWVCVQIVSPSRCCRPCWIAVT